MRKKFSLFHDKSAFEQLSNLSKKDITDITSENKTLLDNDSVLQTEQTEKTETLVSSFQSAPSSNKKSSIPEKKKKFNIYLTQSVKIKIKKNYKIIIIKIILLAVIFLYTFYTDILFRVKKKNLNFEIKTNKKLNLNLENRLLTKSKLNIYNNSLDKKNIFIPFKIIITSNQTQKFCADKNLFCLKDSDCDLIPLIFFKETSKCGKIASYSDNEEKGCIIEGWCPRENLYTRETKNILVNVDDLEIEIRKFNEKYERKIFPSPRANFFTMKNLVKGAGVNYDEISNIGGIIEISMNYNCYFFFFEKCFENFRIFPFSFFDDSIGFSFKKTDKLFNIDEIRNENHYIGLFITVNGKKITKKFDFFLFYIYIIVMFVFYNFLLKKILFCFFKKEIKDSEDILIKKFK